MTSGRVIILEGIDGCGKTTQAKMLEEYLNSKGIMCKLFREPGGLESSETIRDLLLHTDFDFDPITEVLLFSSSRRELITKKLLPFLEQGGVVILDRFISSTVAYQGYGREIPIDTIDTINDIVIDSLDPYPITEILIDIPIDIAASRMSDEKDRIEDQEESFFLKVRDGYKELWECSDDVVDGSKSVSDVHKDILNLVNL